MNSIEISNFKNFRHLKIDNLGAVNLIVGKNNAGKSSLLEAISILASGGNIGWIKNLLELRGMPTRYPFDTQEVDSKEQENFRTLYHGYDCNNFKTDPIKITATDTSTLLPLENTVEIKLIEVVDIVDVGENGTEITRRVPKEYLDEDAIISSNPQPALLITFNDSLRTMYVLGQNSRRYYIIDKNTPFEYVRTAEFTGEKNPDLFDRIALTSLEPELIKALHIIDNRIEAINFLKDIRPASLGRNEDNRVPFVVLSGKSDKYRLSTMGDGINRVLTIILSLLNSRGGILMIDEFENGLHYSVQRELWGLISDLARKLDVQVFATTHSNDCIKSFLHATGESGKSRLIRLEKRDSGEIAVVYDEPDELDYIANNDVEIR